MTTNGYSRALVIVAHPDDAEFGCAGTVARWAREGWDVFMVMCTDGGKGSSDPDMSPERLAKIRQEEQREAARVVGIKEVVFLGHPDGELEDDRDLRREIVREIRRFRPDVVICQDPYRRGHNHRDHRTAGQVAFDACYPYARDYHHFPELIGEGFMPHKVAEIYAMGSDDPDIYVGISDVIGLKIEALKAHRSQMLDFEGLADRIMERSAEVGRKVGHAYAEAFGRHQFRR